jgi:C-terminal processing protease CtpA/Prc
MKMDKIIDAIFGEMLINHGWQKKQTVQFWGKPVSVKIKAAQYSNKEITDTQRKNYQYVMDNITEIAEKCKKSISDYQNAIKPIISGDIANLVIPHTFIFFADGKYGILFDCKWDEEHGLGVTLPEYQVGPQDILL